MPILHTMSAVTLPHKRVLKNVLLLAGSQALAMSCLSLTITVSALAGTLVAPNENLATLPLALQFLGTMLATIPASLFMRRFGRRAGFSLGASSGIAAGIVSAYALIADSFILFCIGGLLIGVFAAHVAFYRFAAADSASEAYKSRAISLVLAGGLVAAFAGPELAKHTREMISPVLFAGGYAAIAVVATIKLGVLQFLQIPNPGAYATSFVSGRPLREILRQPVFLVAVLSAMVGYGAMNFVMVSTPLAMVACAHPFETAAFVIQWHVVGMYAPSFFTGYLIYRHGAERIIALGACLIAGCVLVNLSGVAVIQFWTALVLLGLGWNFMYIGGSALLTQAYRPEENAKVQAVNEFCVFGTTTLTAFSSGAVFNALGWGALNLAIVLPLVATLLAVLWMARAARRTQPVS